MRRFNIVYLIVSNIFFASCLIDPIFPLKNVEFQDMELSSKSSIHNSTSKKYTPSYGSFSNENKKKLILLSEKIEAGSEFKNLKTSSKNFRQSSNQSACILYSFLYGVLQNKKLSQDFEDLLSKDENGNYYVKDVKITKNTIDSASFNKHPSKKLVLRAIGEYVVEEMENKLSIPHFENYVLTDWDAKDLFFGKPIVVIPYKKWIEAGVSKFCVDGSIKIDDKYYKGDFVASWSRNGHARCMYFSSGKWHNYDNQSDGPTDITRQNVSYYTPDVDVMLIGYIN